jgi:hypothetical protein
MILNTFRCVLRVQRLTRALPGSVFQELGEWVPLL